MAEDEEQELPPAPAVPEKKESPIIGLISQLKKGKGGIDPMTFMLISSELRRQERDERRAQREDDEWRERKNRGHDSNQQKPVDVKALLEEQNKEWETRFEKQQKHIETMFLGKKLEDTEERAKAAEKKLKDKEEKEAQERLVAEKVAPLNKRVEDLTVLLAQKTAGMTSDQKKNAFVNISEEIEKSIGGEIGDRIKKTLADAFAPREDEGVATTKEGGIDYGKEVFKSLNKGLKVVETYIGKMPAGPPAVKEVKKLPPVKELTPAQQRLAEKIRRGEPVVPPPAPTEIKEVEPTPPKKEKAPPPAPTPKAEEKKPSDKPEKKVEEKLPEAPLKIIGSEEGAKIMAAKAKAEKAKPIKPVTPKKEEKGKPKEEKKPVLPVKEKPVKLAEKTKEKPKRTKTRTSKKTTAKSVDKQTS